MVMVFDPTFKLTGFDGAPGFTNIPSTEMEALSAVDAAEMVTDVVVLLTDAV